MGDDRITLAILIDTISMLVLASFLLFLAASGFILCGEIAERLIKRYFPTIPDKDMNSLVLGGMLFVAAVAALGGAAYMSGIAEALYVNATPELVVRIASTLGWIVIAGFTLYVFGIAISPFVKHFQRPGKKTARGYMRFLIFAVLLSLPVQAQFFPIGFPAQEYTQIMNKIQLIEMEARQLQMYLDQIKHTKVLKNLPWTNVDAHVKHFESALQWSSAIAATMASADAKFRKRFPGYGGIFHNTTYQYQYEVWNTTALDTIAGMLKAGGIQHKQMLEEEGVLDELRKKAQGSEGRLQALQAQAAIAAEVPAQMQKLRALLLADMSSKAMYQAVQLQKEAVHEAAGGQFFRFVEQPDQGNQVQSIQ